MTYIDIDLREVLADRILVLDGAMGTMIQRYKLTEADYRGDRFAKYHMDIKGNNEVLSLAQHVVELGITLHCYPLYPYDILQIYHHDSCLLYTSPSPRDRTRSRMPSSA